MDPLLYNPREYIREPKESIYMFFFFFCPISWKLIEN